MGNRMMQAVCVGLAIAFVAAAAPAPATAQSAADSIKSRKALMRSNSGHFKAIAAYVKKGQGTATEAAENGRAIAANAAKIAALFPKGTGAQDGVGKTRAKAAIWTDRGKFDAVADKLRVEALKFASAAQSGDKKAMGAAMGSIGKDACGSCHRAFRAPRKKK